MASIVFEDVDVSHCLDPSRVDEARLAVGRSWLFIVDSQVGDFGKQTLLGAHRKLLMI